MRLENNRQGAFTLVEIMIVVAIVGLLAGIAVPTYVLARAQSQEKVCVNNLRQLDGAKDEAALENGLGTGDDPAALVDAYIKGGVPVCPVGDTAYTLNTVGTPPACGSSEAVRHNTAFLN